MSSVPPVGQVLSQKAPESFDSYGNNFYVDVLNKEFDQYSTDRIDWERFTPENWQKMASLCFFFSGDLFLEIIKHAPDSFFESPNTFERFVKMTKLFEMGRDPTRKKNRRESIEELLKSGKLDIDTLQKMRNEYAEEWLDDEAFTEAHHYAMDACLRNAHEKPLLTFTEILQRSLDIEPEERHAHIVKLISEAKMIELLQCNPYFLSYLSPDLQTLICAHFLEQDLQRISAFLEKLERSSKWVYPLYDMMFPGVLLDLKNADNLEARMGEILEITQYLPACFRWAINLHAVWDFPDPEYSITAGILVLSKNGFSKESCTFFKTDEILFLLRLTKEEKVKHDLLTELLPRPDAPFFEETGIEYDWPHDYHRRKPLEALRKNQVELIKGYMTEMQTSEVIDREKTRSFVTRALFRRQFELAKEIVELYAEKAGEPLRLRGRDVERFFKRPFYECLLEAAKLGILPRLNGAMMPTPTHKLPSSLLRHIHSDQERSAATQEIKLLLEVGYLDLNEAFTESINNGYASTAIMIMENFNLDDYSEPNFGLEDWNLQGIFHPLLEEGKLLKLFAPLSGTVMGKILRVYYSGEDRSKMYPLILQAKTGCDSHQAEAIFARLESIPTMEARQFYEVIVHSRLNVEQAEKLLTFFEELLTTPGMQVQDKRSDFLEEFFAHIFLKFRPEFLEGEMEQLEPLLNCWKELQSAQKGEIALFFNALQSQNSLEDIAQAIQGSRLAFKDLASSSDDEIIQMLSFIKVARCQEGRPFALEVLKERSDMEREALRALASLRIPLRPDIVTSLEERFAQHEVLPETRAELLRLFWAMRADPFDASLKAKVLEIFEKSRDELGGELLEASLEILECLEWTPEEIDPIWPTLESLSRSDDQSIRIRCALAFSRISHEKALLRATEIVQSSDWAKYDSQYGAEKYLHVAHYLKFSKRPDFQDNRSSMITRILDRLTRLKKGHIHPKIDSFEEYEEDVLRNLDGSHGTSRFFATPVYFPKRIPLLRGLKARKGDSLFRESILDLLRHGSERSDLTKFDSHIFGTWSKMGIVFATSSEKCLEHYSDVVIQFQSGHYNRALMKGFGRLEFEVGLNNVIYGGVPWREIEKVELPERWRVDFEALRGEQPLREIEWEAEIFCDAKVEELEELRFNLRTIFDKFVFGIHQPQEDTGYLDGIKRKTLKRHFQREEVKKLYPKETFATQDEILETFSDEEYESILPRIEDIFHVTATRTPHTENLSPRLRKIARLAALFSSAPVNLHALRPLHGASPEEMLLVEALIQRISYGELYEKMGYHLCTREEYAMLSKGDQDV